MVGILIHLGNRPDIIFEDGTIYGGLHCGECFEVHHNHWISVRLEYTDNWVLVSNTQVYPICYGLRVRMPA